MSKYLIYFFTFNYLLTGCETASVIKEYEPANEQIYIDVVQKNLNLEGSTEGPYSQKVKKSLQKWLEDSIKTSGYDGELDIELLSIKTSEKILENSVRIEMSLELNFIIANQVLSKKRSKLIKVNEFGKLTGSFSLDDKDTEVNNIIKRLLQRLGQIIAKEVI